MADGATDTVGLPGIRLADAISQVRRELAQAIEEGRDSPVAFRAGPVELEFEVVVEASAGADAGVRVWVVSLGARGEVKRGDTHRLRVTLTPVDRQGQDKLIGSTGSK
ncbi:hypothetical protein JCM18899A_25240 [Nocardioides sp. AN3]